MFIWQDAAVSRARNICRVNKSIQWINQYNNDTKLYEREVRLANWIAGLTNWMSPTNSTAIFCSSSDDAVESTSFKYWDTTASLTASASGMKKPTVRPMMKARNVAMSSWFGLMPNWDAKKLKMLKPSSLLIPVKRSTWLWMSLARILSGAFGNTWPSTTAKKTGSNKEKTSAGCWRRNSTISFPVAVADGPSSMHSGINRTSH